LENVKRRNSNTYETPCMNGHKLYRCLNLNHKTNELNGKVYSLVCKCSNCSYCSFCSWRPSSSSCYIYYSYVFQKL